MEDYTQLGYDNLLNYGTENSAPGSVLGSSSSNALQNPITDVVHTEMLESGNMISELNMARHTNIRGGQTDWMEGEGYWMGWYEPGEDYRISIGDGDTNFFNFDGEQINASGNLNQQIRVTAGEAISEGDCVCIRKYEYNKLRATEDANTSEASPNTNNGTSSTFSLGSGNALGTSDRYAFVKFDISGTNIEGLNHYHAILRLARSSISGTPADDFEIEIAQVLDDWDETTVTWNNQPSAGFSANYDFADGMRFTAPYIADDNNNYIVFDVTDFFTQWYFGEPNYGLRLRLVERATGTESTTATQTLTVHSSEATVERPPQLIIFGASTKAGQAFLAEDSGDDWTNLNGKIGFAKNSAAAGEDVTIQLSGIVNNPSGPTPLDLSRTYYVSNTAGEISTRPNTIDLVEIGVATSTSTIVMSNPIPKILMYEFECAAGTTAGETDVNFDLRIPIGFYARHVEFKGTASIAGNDYEIFYDGTLGGSYVSFGGVSASGGSHGEIVSFAPDVNHEITVEFFQPGFQQIEIEGSSVIFFFTFKDLAAPFNPVSIHGMLTFTE